MKILQDGRYTVEINGTFKNTDSDDFNIAVFRNGIAEDWEICQLSGSSVNDRLYFFFTLDLEADDIIDFRIRNAEAPGIIKSFTYNDIRCRIIRESSSIGITGTGIETWEDVENDIGK